MNVRNPWGRVPLGGRNPKLVRIFGVHFLDTTIGLERHFEVVALLVNLDLQAPVRARHYL